MPNLFDLPRPFFPNPVFAWTSVGLLIAALGVAAYTDTKRAKVPNPLVVTMLVVGLILNVARGVWKAAVATTEAPYPSWLFGNTDNLWLGGLDGFLFGLSGFAVGFGVFFVVWMFGLMGGGDMKLFSALGGWVGFLHLVMAWVLSVGVLLVWTLAKVVAKGLRPSKVQASIKQLQKSNQVGREAANKPGGSKKLRVTYSFPIAVAVSILSLWSHRAELLLAPPRPVPPPEITGAKSDDPPPPDQPK